MMKAFLEINVFCLKVPQCSGLIYKDIESLIESLFKTLSLSTDQTVNMARLKRGVFCLSFAYKCITES